MPDTVNFFLTSENPRGSFGSMSSLGSKSAFVDLQRENNIFIKLCNEKLKLKHFNFGAIPCGSIHEKTLQLVNHTLKNQVYIVERDPASRTEDNFIEVISLPAGVKPGNAFKFKLRYFPQIPLALNIDYFNVYDSEGICLKFSVNGFSSGPSLSTSDQKLTFLSFQGATKLNRQVIEFTNDSDVLAQYMFDVHIYSSIFKTDPLSGTVKPKGSTYVGITFDPPGPGIYTKDLVCLVLYQTPIIIRLEAVCTQNELKLKWKNLNIGSLPQPHYIKHGYEWYFMNEQIDLGARNDLIVRAGNIDFGGTQVGIEDLPKHFSVHNTARKNVFLNWCPDPRNNFTITPQAQEIAVGCVAVFEVRFRPTEEDRLYSAEIDGCGFWDYIPMDEKDFKNYQPILMPINVTVRMMGHTFPDDSDGWLPQIEIVPKCVNLPPCVPHLSTFSMFCIRRFGHLPVIYKIIPPTNTRFVVRPKQGAIVLGLQLVVVQFSPEEREGVIEEKWIIRFNGMPLYDEEITFRGYGEYPTLTMETIPINVVHFPPTHPECVGFVDVPIRNMTRHCIRYRFLSSESLTKVTMEDGDTMIASNEVVNQRWSFIPHDTGVRELGVVLETVVLKDCSFPISTPIEMPILTYQQSQLDNLVAFPRVVDFGPSLLEVKKLAKFRLFNFGICPIHYYLTCIQRNNILGNCADDINLPDRWQTVPPSSSVEVEVLLCPSLRGLQEFAVFYQVSRSATTNRLIDDPSKEVIRINYEGIIPIMRVIEFKPLFYTEICPKDWLWVDMDIGRMNKLIETSMPNSNYSVKMKPPPAIMGAESLTVYIYLKNNGEVDTEWSLKRKQICQCQKVQRSRGISFRDILYECPHRELLVIDEPHSGNLKVGQVHTWLLKVHYKLAGVHELCYTLELSNKRKFMIFVLITVIPEDKFMLLPISSKMDFNDVYIGDLRPLLKMFWLYNFGYEESDYEVDTVQIDNFNNSQYDTHVLECLNPKGVVKPKYAHAIFFKLDPGRLQSHEITLPIRLGGKTMKIRILGNGGVCQILHTDQLDIPPGGKIYTPELPVVFSLDRIIVKKPIPIHTKIVRTFLLLNQTNYLYSYKWNKLRVHNIVYATVTPAKGHLEPFQTIMCKITIVTGSHPTEVDTFFTVKTFNLTEAQIHAKSVFLFREQKRLLEGQFIISSQGFREPMNCVTISPKPVPVRMTIGLKCQVLGPGDIEAKVPLRDQLKYVPGIELDLTKKPTAPDLSAEDAEIVTDELEKILWDVMSSKWMEETIFQFSHDEVYYSQFFMKRREEAIIKERIALVPSRRLVQIIVNHVNYQIMEEYFGYSSVADESDLYTSQEDNSTNWMPAGYKDSTKGKELDHNVESRWHSKFGQ